MMRRSSIYPAMLAMLLTVAIAGCRRESQPLTLAEDTIRFSVSQPGSAELGTKALTPDNPTIGQIKVWADKSDGDASWSQLFANQPQTVAKEDDNWNYWGSGLPIRWTRDAGYRFRSVFPTTADTQSGSGSDRLEINYSMYDEYDLLVAASNFASKPDGGIVPLTFHHANAAVCVRFQSNVKDTYLTHFELNNLYTTGTLYYTGAGEDRVSMDEWTRHGLRAQQVYPWTGKTSASSLTFVVDLTSGSEKVKVTTSEDAPADNEAATIWIEYGDGIRKGLTPDSTEPENTIYRVKVEDFESSWGFHIVIGNRTWGGDGTLLTLDNEYPIIKNAADIGFAYSSALTQYWRVPPSATVFGGWHFAIPQELNVDDNLNPAVSFTYAIGQMSISETLDLPVVSGATGIKWEAGKVYLYSIQIQPESKISVSVEDWDSFYVSTDDVIFTD